MIIFLIIAALALLSAIARAILYLPYGTYTILKNKHYSIFNNSVIRPRLFSLKNGKKYNRLKFTATVTPARYYINGRQQDQVNKIFGYSTHLFRHHHKGSVRLGWSYKLDGVIELFAYWYTKSGHRHITKIGEANLQGNAFSVDVEMCTTATQHIFCVNGEFFAVEHEDKPSKYGWILMPYFGGKEPAPSDITISIQHLTYGNSFIRP